jgi:3-oxoacyl-[acyl-carrier protein] reductase
MKMEKLVENKNILITGVSRGLGYITAKNLLDVGYNVYGIGRTINNKLNEYPNFKHIEIDLENCNELEAILKTEIGNSIPLHGFVNNAAIAYDDIITNMDIDKLKSMYDVNVFSPFIITKFVIRNMIYNKIMGSIVHISSISVHTGYNGLSMYASTKGALEAFSKNTAREWGRKGIRSNCIVAGFMETDMSNTLSTEQKDRIYNRTSLKKPTDMNSVSKTIEFIISDNSNSITGQLINVDSGTI